MAENGEFVRGALLRKWVHLLGGIPALVPWSRPTALIVTGFGTIFNATALQRFPFFREWRRGARDVGYITYPLSLFAAFLLFGADAGRAAWVELAVGDWAATYFGIRLGGPGIPWNRRKRWWGVAAHAAFGFAAVWLFSTVSLHATWDPWRVAGILVVCALAETILSEGWDNVLVVVTFSALIRLAFPPRP